MTPLEKFANAIWGLSLIDLQDVMAGYEIGHDLLDRTTTDSLRWLSRDAMALIADDLAGGADDGQRRKLVALVADASDIEALAILPDLDGCEGAWWLACEDGIAGLGSDSDGGEVVTAITWEDLGL